MKKKTLALVLAMVMAFGATFGATFAYLQSQTDAVVNTFTVGNVTIAQHETDKAGADFVDGQGLYPMVDKRAEGEETVVEGFFSENMKNVVDKVVTVENTGSEAAYVRTVIAFETARHYAEGSDTEFTDMHDVYIGTLGDFEFVEGEYITVDGVEYKLAVCVYEEALEPEATTEPSLKQFFLAPTAGNEAVEIFGNEYTILAVSQGVQTNGFEEVGAAAALNEAFGEVTAENAAAWFANAQ